jgi:hypothetical protein
VIGGIQLPTPPPTVDELVATLQRSNLPTLLVEGVDDAQVYRWLQNRLRGRRIDVLPCGGRTNLIALYRRRREFTRVLHAFLADNDMWLFTAVPIEFAEIIWTSGYSIENDLYAGSTVELLLDENEHIQFLQLMKVLGRWFAFEVEEYRAHGHSQVGVHVNQLVPPGALHLDGVYCADRGFREPLAETVLEIESDYRIKIRGKQLFDALLRFLSVSTRPARHNRRSLLEICLKMTPDHIYMDRLVHDILAKFP